MLKWLLTNLCASFEDLLIFLLGFLIGTIIDIIGFSIYQRIDPKKEHKGKLLSLDIVQIFIIIFIIHVTTKSVGSSLTLGLMSSQVFLFVDVIKTIDNRMTDRDCSDN